MSEKCEKCSELIQQKEKKKALTKEDIEHFVKCVVKKTIQDEQIDKMLYEMKTCDLNDEETANLTRAMIDSGVTLEWPKIVDKHSTGGVGDKVSLVLAPALAACGVKVPMISGRALEHTGGTLDKLESIPGFNVSLSTDEIVEVVSVVGCCIAGQTENLVPADKILYKRRDETKTVDCNGLITSSIISKKASEKLDALVLDVKFGKGAFKKDEQSARKLAVKMVKAGNDLGIKTKAYLTDMDAPLGYMVGNSLEVKESIQCLHGDGPQELIDLVIRFGGQLLFEVGKASGMKEAYTKINETLHDGSAIAKFEAMIKAQGVNDKIADELCKNGAEVLDILPKAKYSTHLLSEAEGYIHDIDALTCGLVSGKLGASRTLAIKKFSFGVGLELSAQTCIGKHIEKGSRWVTVHHEEEKLSKDLESMLKGAIQIKPEPVRTALKGTRVFDVISYPCSQL